MTDPLDLRTIGRAMSIIRLKIPAANIPKFDVESKEYYAAISEAVRAGEADRAGKLLSQWNVRAAWAANPGWHHAPPALIKIDGESITQWLKRCYEAMHNQKSRIL